MSSDSEKRPIDHCIEIDALIESGDIVCSGKLAEACSKAGLGYKAFNWLVKRLQNKLSAST